MRQHSPHVMMRISAHSPHGASGPFKVKLSFPRLSASQTPRYLWRFPDEVEAVVLIDGVDLHRILVDAALTQPADGTPLRDWCAR